MAMDKQPIFDTPLFQQRVGSLSTFRKAAEVYLVLLPTWTELVQEALRRRDWESLSLHVHQMKGSSSMLCAHPVHHQLQRVDDGLRLKDEAAIRDAIGALFQVLQAAEAELRSVWLKED